MGNSISGTINSIKNRDLDDLFSYNTPKVLRVRDRRLGIPYYTFMIVIFVYICYAVIVEQRYLKTEEPGGGSIRTTLQLNTTEVDSKGDNPDAILKNANSEETIQWLYWSTTQAASVQDGSLFITTRVSERSFQYNSACNAYFPTKRECRPKMNNEKKTYYVADIEDMTLMIEHTIRGNLLSITEVNGNLYGELLDKNEKVIWRFYPNKYSKEINKSGNYTIRDIDKPGDIFKIGTLLDAVDLNLSEKINNNEEPYRYTGCVIVIIIEYTNKGNTIEYKYKPTLIENAEMKILELVRDGDYINPDVIKSLSSSKVNLENKSNGWIEYNRHGIEIKFVQLGSIGQFDFMALCMNLVASIAMLSVASTIVESLMLYILPQKGVYRRFKFEITDDFSDIRDHEREAKMEKKKREEEERQKAAKIEDV